MLISAWALTPLALKKPLHRSDGTDPMEHLQRSHGVFPQIQFCSLLRTRYLVFQSLPLGSNAAEAEPL